MLLALHHIHASQMPILFAVPLNISNGSSDHFPLKFHNKKICLRFTVHCTDFGFVWLIIWRSHINHRWNRWLFRSNCRVNDSKNSIVWKIDYQIPCVFLSWFHWTRLHFTFVYQMQTSMSFWIENCLFGVYGPCMCVCVINKTIDSNTACISCLVWRMTIYRAQRNSDFCLFYLSVASICADCGGFWLQIDHITLFVSEFIEKHRTFHQTLIK